MSRYDTWKLASPPHDEVYPVDECNVCGSALYEGEPAMWDCDEGNWICSDSCLEEKVHNPRWYKKNNVQQIYVSEVE